MENGTFKETDMANAVITNKDFLDTVEDFRTQHRNGRNPIGFNR